MRRVFFYGLFMDVDLLAQQAFETRTIGTAKLPGFELRIGDRATLLPCKDAVSYGVLVDMPDDDLRRLYSGPGVAGYRAETVKARLLADASEHVAQCYNLPADRLEDAVNVAYARRLARLVKRLDFPAGYAAQIDAIADAQASVTDDDAG